MRYESASRARTKYLGTVSATPGLPQITNTELEVCSIETQRRHPELFHYTKREAFKSIVKSNAFWASHYKTMADKNEIVLLRHPLIAALAPRYDALVSSLNRRTRRLYKKGGCGEGVARDLVNALYRSTFENKGGFTSLDAFITSFSTHSDDAEFVRANGLDAQWAEYAGKDGFCMVFDTAALAQLLGQEMDSRYWVYLSLRPVRYFSEGTPIGLIFPELVDAAADTLRQCLDGAPHDIGLRQFLVGSSLLKATKYTEEREVRLVAIPGTKSLSDQALKEYPNQFKVTPIPEIGTRPDTRRYVSVFEPLNLRLPLTRVIVGPSDRQEENAIFARSLVGDVPVSCSQCSLESVESTPTKAGV